MAPPRRDEEFELLSRASQQSNRSSGSLDLDFDERATNFANAKPLRRRPGWLCIRLPLRILRVLHYKLSSPRRSRRPLVRLIYWAFVLISCFIFLLVVFTAIFRPSYTHLPAHYKALRRRFYDSREPGRGNVNKEKVFIAATLYDADGTLVRGDWGDAVLRLVDLLGPENVHLSIYEDNPRAPAKAALRSLGVKLTCKKSLVAEPLSLSSIQRVTVLNGEKLMRRMAFLAEVRNHALDPIATDSVKYDKLLYLNDVMFHPEDAVQLLFSTNVDSSGKAQYGAACAFDFINAFKFYDRFASRDFEGYTMGIPFFPWFTNAGNAESRRDVLAQKDAVRVRACWGGMVAFEAKWFQKQTTDSKSEVNRSPKEDVKALDDSKALDVSPLRFRYEQDYFWDASECCLIHADLTYLRHGSNSTSESGIYANPYIRVAYDSRTLSWLPYTRRVERLYSWIHNLLNHLVRFPEANPRRLTQPGDEATEKIWRYDGADAEARGAPKGSYHDENRVASPGQFCGQRKMLVLRDKPEPGEKPWYKVDAPPLPK